MIRDVAVKLARARLRFPATQADLLQNLDASLKQGADCSFLVGEHLLISGKPCWVHFFRGEMFVFDLSPRQARRNRVEPNSMQSRMAPAPEQARPGARYPIELGPIQIAGSGRVAGAAPVSGRCSYSIAWDRMWDTGPGYAVRLDYQTPDGKTTAAWHYPTGPLGAAGTLAFTFPPLQPPDGLRSRAPRGSLTLFVGICNVPDPHRPDGRTSISNTRAELVDIE